MNLESGYLTAMRAEYQRLTGALPEIGRAHV